MGRFSVVEIAGDCGTDLRCAHFLSCRIRGAARVAILFFTAWRGRSAAVVVAGLAGCILGWAWLTREEGIWFLPGLGLLAAGAILINRKERSELLALARNLSIATVGFLVVNAAFMTENLIAYGLFVGVDFKEHNFNSVIDALQNVDAGPIIPYVPVP